VLVLVAADAVVVLVLVEEVLVLVEEVVVLVLVDVVLVVVLVLVEVLVEDTVVLAARHWLYPMLRAIVELKGTEAKISPTRIRVDASPSGNTDCFSSPVLPSTVGRN
jgi:hypothetical protein